MKKILSLVVTLLALIALSGLASAQTKDITCKLIFPAVPGTPLSTTACLRTATSFRWRHLRVSNTLFPITRAKATVSAM